LEDWIKFLRLQFHNREPEILDRKTLQKLTVPTSGNYAAGWINAG